MLYSFKRCFLVLILLLLVTTGCSCSKNSLKKLKNGYISGTTNEVMLLDNDFNETISIKRGSEVKIISEAKDGGLDYYKIEYGGKNYYVFKNNISSDKDSVVKEKELLLLKLSLCF